MTFPLSHANVPGPSPTHENLGNAGLKKASAMSVATQEMTNTATTFRVVRYSKSKLPAMTKLGCLSLLSPMKVRCTLRLSLHKAKLRSAYFPDQWGKLFFRTREFHTVKQGVVIRLERGVIIANDTDTPKRERVF